MSSQKISAEEKRKKDELFQDVKKAISSMHRSLALAIRSKNKQQLANSAAETLLNVHDDFNRLDLAQKKQINLSMPEKTFLDTRPKTTRGAVYAIAQRLLEYENGGSSAMLSGTKYNSSRASGSGSDPDTIFSIASLTLQAAGVDSISKLKELCRPLIGMNSARSAEMNCKTISLITAYTSCVSLNPEVCKKIMGGKNPRERSDRVGEAHTGNILPENAGKLSESSLFIFWASFLTKTTPVSFDKLVHSAIKSTRRLL